MPSVTALSSGDAIREVLITAGIDAEKIVAIPAGVDTAQFHRRSRALRCGGVWHQRPGHRYGGHVATCQGHRVLLGD